MKETGRLEAFSDGVFAIAITLLVLELKVPSVGLDAQALTARLLEQWPSYLALVTSFFTVLIMWVHHHMLFRLVHRVDSTLLFTNGLLLLLISVVAYPTAVVAEYLMTPAAPAACLFYCGTFVLISISFYLLVHAAFRDTIVDPNAPAELCRRIRRSYRWGPPLYALSAVAAPFLPWLAIGICTALWIFWAVMTREVCASPESVK